MPLFRNALVAALISLSTCSVGCQKPQVVTVPVPSPTCDPGPIPAFPRLAPEVCVDGEVELVCMTPVDAAAIWAWARDMGRWSERALLCADTKDAPLGLVDTSDILFGSDTVYRLPQLAGRIADPRVRIDVSLKECGFQNAFYHPASRTITFCTEMLVHAPGAVRFFLAHEVAHAYIVQLDLPFTGSHEAAADELAAYLMIKAGYAEDLITVAKYWDTRDEATGSVPTWADHPANGQRAWTLGCLGAEATGRLVPLCRGDLTRIKHNWERLLK